MIALLMVQFIAFPSAIAYSSFAKKNWYKKCSFLCAIGGYSLATFLGYWMSERVHFSL